MSDERKLTMIVFPFHCIFHTVHLVALPHFYIVPKISLYIFKKSWIIALKCMENMGRGRQGTVDVSADRRKSFSSFLSVPPPSCPSSLPHRYLFLCGNWTPKMRQNVKWSDTMAFKALPLPCPSLFMFYPNKWWSRKQEVKLRNKNTRDQVGLYAVRLNFCSSSLLPTN